MPGRTGRGRRRRAPARSLRRWRGRLEGADGRRPRSGCSAQIVGGRGRAGASRSSTPPKSTASTSTARRCRRCVQAVMALGAAAGVRARRRLPRPGPPDAAAAGDRRRPAIHGDRRRVDSGEGHARSADGRAARAGPAIRLRPAQGLRDARRISTPSAGSATRRCTGARSGRQRCLIRCRTEAPSRRSHSSVSLLVCCSPRTSSRPGFCS